MSNKYLYQYEQEATPTTGVLLAGHYIESYGFYGHRTRGTKDWLLIYTRAGKGSFRLDHEIHSCHEGDLVLLAPGTPHHYAADEGHGWELLWAHFLPLPEWEPWMGLPKTEEGFVRISIPAGTQRSRMENALMKLVQDAAIDDRWSGELARLSLAEVILLANQASIQASSPLHLDERIALSMQYMITHLGEKHSLADLSRAAELSESRFRHLFKEQTGCSVKEWITASRLYKSAKLLELTSSSVKEIAYLVGFDNAFYFTRRFTERFSVSPTVYRRQAQQRG
ncbi:helix-turn-helix domain-containing protein [Paenibacillus sp. GCM10023252]|uniref:helix-turn-helix domain-containing protein n=1 Tax=Paenibacillus sp. GCM10023252 TaxID=3252649 RepID=UPI003616E22D